MYFWNIEQLKDDIKSDRFTEKDRFIYAFIYIVVSAAIIEAISYIPIENQNIWDAWNSAGNILVLFIGTLYAYKANGAADGKDFLGRFFSINFVVGIRLLPLLIPMFIVLFFYYYFSFTGEELIVSAPIDIIPFQLWLVLLYWRTCRHINDVKNHTRLC